MFEGYFEYIYWKDAGLNRKTGNKTLTLKQFEEKYLDSYKAVAVKIKGRTVEERMLQMNPLLDELKEAFKTFYRLYNVEWPPVHLETAKHYLDSKGENKVATGGSKWKKYLHPKL